MLKEEFQRDIMVMQHRMYRFALSYMKDEDDAKDVVQDVLMKLWETKVALKEKQNIEAWAMSLVKNKSLDKLKRVGRKFKTEIDNVHHSLKGIDNSPIDTLTNKEGMQMVKQAIKELPKNQGQAFFLREIEGYSYDEISEVLEMNMSQVKVNIFRARKAVRSELEKKYAYGQ